MKIGVFIAAHDGLQSMLTGVGVMVSSFVEAFPEIKKEIDFLDNKEIDLIGLAPYMKKDSNDFNTKIQKLTDSICKENRGKLIEISTFSDGSSGKSIWGNHLQWRGASLSAASMINSLENKYDLIYVIGHDTIFSLIGKYLLPSKKIKFIWIPHSLGKVFDDESSNKERIKIESEAVQTINNNPLFYLGYIGESFRKILIKKYGAKNEKMLSLINGIYGNSQSYSLYENDIQRIEDRYNIPKNKKWIFSWGRCVNQKGYDLIISAYEEFVKKFPEYHLILLMPTETSERDYVEKIKNQLKSLPQESFTAIYSFDDKLPNYVLQNPNLEMIIFASRFEGNPIIGLEALYFHKDAKILYSEIGPLKELFNNIEFATEFSLTSGDLLNKMLKTKSQGKIRGSKKIEFVDNYIMGLSKFFK